MFKLVLVAILLGLVAADNIDKDAKILSYTNEPADAEGNFAFAFDTSNGINIQERGNIAGVGGGAQWTSPEGTQIQFVYTADADGYHPSGAHLPTPPPIPEYILRSLEYIRTHPHPEVVPNRG